MCLYLFDYFITITLNWSLETIKEKKKICTIKRNLLFRCFSNQNYVYVWIFGIYMLDRRTQPKRKNPLCLGIKPVNERLEDQSANYEPTGLAFFKLQVQSISQMLVYQSYDEIFVQKLMHFFFFFIQNASFRTSRFGLKSSIFQVVYTSLLLNALPTWSKNYG